MNPNEGKTGGTETRELSPEQMDRFLAETREPLREREQEKRRSIEISTSFFEKLATLSAGSIAVAASITLATAVRKEASYDWVRILAAQ